MYATLPKNQASDLTTDLAAEAISAKKSVVELQIAPEKRKAFIWDGTHNLKFQSIAGHFSLAPCPKRDRRNAADPMGLSSDRIWQNDLSVDAETQSEIDFYQLNFNSQKRCNKGGAIPETDKGVRGRNGMTKHQKMMTTNGVGLLYEQRTKLPVPAGTQNQLVAYTLGHPTKYADGTPLSEEDHRRVVCDHSRIRKEFFDELKNEQQAKGIPPRYLGVTEAYMKMWEALGVLRFHIHCVFYNLLDFCKLDEQGRPTYAIHYSRLDDIAARVYGRVLGKPVDTRALGRVETINDVASLGAYLGKTSRIGRYMSKGSKIVQEAVAAGVEIPRMDWMVCDAETRRLVNESVHEFEIKTNINELHDAVILLNAEHEEKVGRPLFTTPYNHTVEDCPIVVAALFRVVHRDDRAVAAELLLNKLRELSPRALTEEEYWIQEFDRLESTGQVERGREFLERIFALADTG